jgi:hypothetical protein
MTTPLEEARPMPSSPAWKQLERDAAAALGGERTPAAAGHGGADVLAPGLVVECKHRASSAHGTMYRAERAKRRKDLAGGDLFVLVTRDRGREALATVTLAELADLLRRAEVLV